MNLPLKRREPIPVHPPGLHVHPPLLTRTLSRGNLKFPLRITQLHTKFSRQFKGLHMILSNLKSFNFVFKELQYRCFSTSFATYETLQTGLHPFEWKGVWQHVHLAALHLAALHLAALHLLPVWDLDPDSDPDFAPASFSAVALVVPPPSVSVHIVRTLFV